MGGGWWKGRGRVRGREILKVNMCVWDVLGGVTEEMVVWSNHHCAGALHQHPRDLSKFSPWIKVIKQKVWSSDRSLVYSPLRTVCSLTHSLAHSLTRSPAHRGEIMVFAFICQRSIFQTSDKRGNWTGNRLKCCKSTKHNYQKALTLANWIHILKMLKWTSQTQPLLELLL